MDNPTKYYLAPAEKWIRLLFGKYMQLQVNLTAQNPTAELKTPNHSLTFVAAIATDPNTAANANFVLEVEITHVVDANNNTTSSNWINVGLYDAIANANIAGGTGITGASKYAWADVPGVDKVRVRRTDSNGGNGTVAISLTANKV